MSSEVQAQGFTAPTTYATTRNERAYEGMALAIAALGTLVALGFLLALVSGTFVVFMLAVGALCGAMVVVGIGAAIEEASDVRRTQGRP